MSEGMPLLKLFDTISKSADTSLGFQNLTLKQSQDVQLELFQNQTQFHLDQIESVQENECNYFFFPLTLWPSAEAKVTKNTTKLYEKMLTINKAGMNEFDWNAWAYRPTLEFLPCKTNRWKNITEFTFYQHWGWVIPVTSSGYPASRMAL